jgi:dTDP-4-dehydrorhamnose 3,5-epimerase
MQIIETELAGPKIIVPDIFEDSRGFFMETYHEKRYQESGIDIDFVQDNLSFSVKATLRGLHYQHPNEQAKLIYVVQGEIFDVAVDVRPNSLSFGKWVGEFLSDTNKKQLFIPDGFAHGYCVMSDTSLVVYKCSAFYSPGDEKGVLWSDPDLNISWPVKEPIISGKDQKLPYLRSFT